MLHSTALGEMYDNLFVDSILIVLQTPLNDQKIALFNDINNY